jgi:hypothetical protein
MVAFSDRLLTALGPDALGKAAHRHFQRIVFFIWLSEKKKD